MKKIKIKFSAILFLAISLIFVYSAVFIVPNQIDKFALIPEKFFRGDYWRLFTFHFSHLNLQHLITNIFGALLVSFLATETKTKFNYFAAVYFLGGIFAVLPFLLTANFTMLGASASIYGAFGMIALKCKNWKVKPIYIYGLIMIAIFFETIIYYLSCGCCEKFLFSSKQSVLHFSGLISGSVLFLSMQKFKQNFEKRKFLALRRG